MMILFKAILIVIGVILAGVGGMNMLCAQERFRPAGALSTIAFIVGLIILAKFLF